jgi:hypothetical protein
MIIFGALKLRKDRFMFDGEDINLICTMTINITMNPDY